MSRGSTAKDRDDEGRRGIFMRLSPAGRSGSAMSAGLACVDVFVNPAAARAREELDQQHERVVPTPSPGDRLLREGVIVIRIADRDPEHRS